MGRMSSSSELQKSCTATVSAFLQNTISDIICSAFGKLCSQVEAPREPERSLSHRKSPFLSHLRLLRPRHSQHGPCLLLRRPIRMHIRLRPSLPHIPARPSSPKDPPKRKRPFRDQFGPFLCCDTLPIISFRFFSVSSELGRFGRTSSLPVVR
jgi:hypothetical protein